jgi:hypothetical protein
MLPSYMHKFPIAGTTWLIDLVSDYMYVKNINLAH